MLCAPRLVYDLCCVQSVLETVNVLYEKVTTNNTHFPLCWMMTLFTNKHIKGTSSTQLCGCTEPILGYLCRNGVSCTFEILILKPPLWLNLLRVSPLDPVPISSECGALCVDLTSADSMASCNDAKGTNATWKWMQMLLTWTYVLCRWYWNNFTGYFNFTGNFEQKIWIWCASKKKKSPDHKPLSYWAVFC